MNRLLSILICIFSSISCSSPVHNSKLSSIYESIAAQKQLYYTVEHLIQRPSDDVNLKLYGLVSLNRNLESGISSAYFGFHQKKLPNYLQSLFLKNEWVYNLSSTEVDHEYADIINDSIHSPILLNPNVLLNLESDSSAIAQERISEDKVKWVLDLTQKGDKLVLIWNEKLKNIMELKYFYEIGSKNTYSKTWKFNYLTKNQYNSLAITYQQQNQVARLPIL